MEQLVGKERTYRIEELFFSPYACRSDRTKGRLREEEPCNMRTAQSHF